MSWYLDHQYPIPGIKNTNIPKPGTWYEKPVVLLIGVNCMPVLPDSDIQNGKPEKTVTRKGPLKNIRVITSTIRGFS